MKLIINIDEDYVKIINKNGASNYPEEVIKNGTPLEEYLHALKDRGFLLYSVDVLDKIRAEIDQIKPYDLPSCDRTAEKMISRVLDIIDKYKGEQP